MKYLVDGCRMRQCRMLSVVGVEGLLVFVNILCVCTLGGGVVLRPFICRTKLKQINRWTNELAWLQDI